MIFICLKKKKYLFHCQTSPFYLRNIFMKVQEQCNKEGEVQDMRCEYLPLFSIVINCLILENDLPILGRWCVEEN